jgi:hypothetical protein
MKNKNALKLLAATFAMSVLLNASPVTAEAASVSAKSNTTDTTTTTATTIDTSVFGLTGTFVYRDNCQGCPDPVIVNNGNNTYTIVMYEGTTVKFDVTNPTYDGVNKFTASIPTFVNYEDVCAIVTDEEESGTSSNGSTTRDDTTELSISAVSVGSAVVNVGLWDGWEDDWDNYIGWTPGYNITIGVFVIPAQAGAQTPVYTDSEIARMQAISHQNDHIGEVAVGLSGVGFSTSNVGK